MSPRGLLVPVVMVVACGDAGSASEGMSASGTGGTGSTGTAATSTGGDVPTAAEEGSHGVSDSGTGTSTGGTEAASEVSGATDTSATTVTGATTGAVSAGETETTVDTLASTGEACVDECVEGEPECVGDGAVRVCGVNDGGCLAWSEPTPCADDEVCEAGACVVGCVDACEAGSAQCEGSGVASCVDDPRSGCTAWSDPVACAQGQVCDAGVCVTPPPLCLEDCVWSKQQVNAGVDLYSVWGSGSKAVWTVGASGTALYYNGTTWKAVDSGVGTRLECVHGSGANDVYAISGDAQIIRWDGMEWLPLVDLDPQSGESACLSVIGPKDLLALVFDASGEKISLYRVTDGVKTLLDEVTPQYVFTPDGSKIRSVSMHAFSADVALLTADRAYRWVGGDLVNMIAPNPSFGLWALAPDLAYAAASHSGIGHRWDGKGWKIVNPGVDGYLHMFTGTANDRVFAVGENKQAVAAIAAFDGIGWSPAATPADAKALFAAWSAATGEVFAVGKAGTILIGK